MSKVATRYAKSLFDLANEKNLLDQVSADMKLINTTCVENKELVNVLKSPVINTDKKQLVLKEIFESKVNKMTSAFLNLLAAKKRERDVPEIAAAFHELYKKHKNILTAVVTTAFGLDDELRKKVYEVIKGSSKSEVELVEKIDNKIIGGFIIRVGDKQDDTSIRTKINKLNRIFKENPYIKEF